MPKRKPENKTHVVGLKQIDGEMVYRSESSVSYGHYYLLCRCGREFSAEGDAVPACMAEATSHQRTHEDNDTSVFQKLETGNW